MAEYIDRLKKLLEEASVEALKPLELNDEIISTRMAEYLILKGVTINENALAEDAVPRSVVEGYIVKMNAYGLTAKRLAEENEKLQERIANQREIIVNQEKAKQEVVREMLEKIKCIVPANTNGDYNDETNWFGFIDHLTEILAEFEKKYIGEKNHGQTN